MKKTTSLLLLSFILCSFSVKEEKLAPHKNGDKAPNFTFYDIEKEKVELSDFKGKFIFMDVWGLYCGPCIKAIPKLNEVREEFKDENIEFICVCWEILENFDVWEERLTKYKTEGKQYLLKDKDYFYGFRKSFITYSIPAYIIIDPKGNFVNIDAPKPSDELKDYLRSILK